MKRKIYQQLLRWKEDKDRKPLMLLGARQVGKTWIMRHFGGQEYSKVAYIAGSLLGVTLGKGESFPVGKVDMLSMYPMDFEG